MKCTTCGQKCLLSPCQDCLIKARQERVQRVAEHKDASDDRCARCAHARVFHQIGTGNGVPQGKAYCDDRHSTAPCDCAGFVERRETRVGIPVSRSIYVIGSLRNPRVGEVANELRAAGHDGFDDWNAGGPCSDDAWRDYERARGRSYKEALSGYAARHIFEYDKHHLDRCEACVLVAPAGKSAHLELGYMIGKGKRGYILLDDPERWDVMYLFATAIFTSVEEMLEVLK